MQEAKHSLTDPEALPHEPTARNLAEGYRYRLAHLGRLIEMEMRLDRRYREFYQSMAMLRQWSMGRCREQAGFFLNGKGVASNDLTARLACQATP